jgi:pyruvate-formate lyase-activating enzyme
MAATTHEMPEKSHLYRLPWSRNDNPIAWLEVTDVCNFACPGCYRRSLKGHKSLAAIRSELDFFQRWRNADCVSIAGGEPLLHPDLDLIVADIAARGLKPIVLTNAALLDAGRVRALAQAGLAGFTLHIDSNQPRPGVSADAEADLNPVRQEYAELIHARRGLSAFFNLTVFPHTVAGIPDVVTWAQSQPEKVDGLIFITYRAATSAQLAGVSTAEERAVLEQLPYVSDTAAATRLSAARVYAAVRMARPGYDACAYLGGTARHDTYKWIVGATFGTPGRVFGPLGPKSMELVQLLHHLWYGSYVSYRAKAATSAPVFLLAVCDRAMRRTAARWCGWLARNPLRLFRRIHLQSIVIVQPPDVLDDGTIDMCDSCPDMTFYAGQMVNSCRLDEYRTLGCMRTSLRAAEPGRRGDD